jgi:hypothetical protein
VSPAHTRARPRAAVAFVLLLGTLLGQDAGVTTATLRLDTFHSGDDTTEKVALDAFRREGEWPGSRTQLLDTTGLGPYQFEVRDLETQALLYSRGYATIFGEWQTTAEARRIWRTFHESVRFPEPRRPFQVSLRKRDRNNEFKELFTVSVDPQHRSVVQAMPAPRAVVEVQDIAVSGPPATKVDILFLGDGYPEKAPFFADSKRLAEVLLTTEPYKSRRNDFNVRALWVQSGKPGISDPRKGTWVDAPLGTTFNTFDVDRYVLTTDNRFVRDVAAQAPYDAMILLCNTTKYGGGGIYNLYSTASAQSDQAPYLVVHEFGHAFAALADEYYTSEIAYVELTPADVEPWEPNITALLDPGRLKWRDLVAKDTPLPTPWDQDAFDKLSVEFTNRRRALVAGKAPDTALEALMAEVKKTTGPLLQQGKHAGKVGAFEGGGYKAKGLYRPAQDCIMFTRNVDRFCPVCARAVSRVIDTYTR